MLRGLCRCAGLGKTSKVGCWDLGLWTCREGLAGLRGAVGPGAPAEAAALLRSAGRYCRQARDLRRQRRRPAREGRGDALRRPLADADAPAVPRRRRDVDRARPLVYVKRRAGSVEHFFRGDILDEGRGLQAW